MKTFRHLFVLAVVLILSGCATNRPAGPYQISGTVEDDQGRPVANALVECYRYAIAAFRPVELEFKRRTRTDAQGAFHFSVSDHAFVVVAQQAGWAPAWRLCVNGPHRVAKERLVFTAPTALTGRLVDEAGEPVADAEVWAFEVASITPLGDGQSSYDVLSGPPARQLFSSRTTADGRFRIEGLPLNAVVNLAASNPGMALREPVLDPNETDTMQFRAGQQDIKLVMEPGGVIEGKVLVQNTPQPLAGVKLWLQSVPAVFSADEGRGPVESGPDGAFRMADVPGGSYRITASFGGGTLPGWISEPVPVSVAVGQTVRGVTVPASAGGLLEARVVDASTRKPLSGAYVSAGNRVYRAGVSTGNRGTARLRLPPGDYEVTAVKGSWSAGLNKARVEPGRTSHIVFRLNPPLKISGILRDPAGAPAADARVSVFPEHGSEPTGTDARGRFEITWNPRPLGSIVPGYQYCLVARDWRRNLAGARDIEETSKSCDLQLQPALVVAGRVTDEQGKPIPKATLKVSLHSRNTVSDLDSYPLGTDAQGRFELTALPPGRAYAILVSAKGYGWIAHQLEANATLARRLELPAIVLKPATRQPTGNVQDAK
jgi:hypothetical protein